MKLRIRHPNGASVLDSLSPEQTVQDLRKAIAPIVGISYDRIQGNLLIPNQALALR